MEARWRAQETAARRCQDNPTAS